MERTDGRRLVCLLGLGSVDSTSLTCEDSGNSYAMVVIRLPHGMALALKGMAVSYKGDAKQLSLFLASSLQLATSVSIDSRSTEEVAILITATLGSRSLGSATCVSLATCLAPALAESAQSRSTRTFIARTPSGATRVLAPFAKSRVLPRQLSSRPYEGRSLRPKVWDEARDAGPVLISRKNSAICVHCWIVERWRGLRQCIKVEIFDVIGGSSVTAKVLERNFGASTF